ncbi:DNA binding domain protein, excisionase family [Planctopirus limnophila DSM 3776]|uniref:DNA binding domain protein, excisionase family n=1 Tax=Planctopirus limnophila (strain ATCC 43296 / DSM 3776 / IFAM 1008 / Mu 290) TaxID=521674 RepID=D5ST66_PLAL2|nr:helix-turn-helix domain-containing protein [Planctopirus limnophila]ADG66834.1 DNA binding domain protein, excisionase family [Planctopirus limnophila DSM 3776]
MPANSPEPLACDRVQAARLLGLSLATLDRLVKRGEVPHRKIGRRVLFCRETLVKWLRGESCDSPANAPVL